MADRVETGAPQPAAATAARRPLTRARILQVALHLIDEQGLEALTMRKLAQELAVDPMSLYRHFENKDALLDGVAEVLWGEINLPGDDSTWEALLRSFATSLRALAHVHPHAYALLVNRQVLSLAMLRLTDNLLEKLQQAGFEQKRAREIGCAVSSFAIGYGMVELSTRLPEQSEQPVETITGIGRLTQVIYRLPRETPAHLVEVACVLTDCDMDAQFIFGLDLMLTSLKSMLG